MIPASFDYKKASSVEEAITLLGSADAKILSGGHSLIPAMKLRLNRPELLVDIKGIEGLDSITDGGDHVEIGANCTHTQIARSEVVQNGVNLLAQAASYIGDVQVRNCGTLGGSLAHADPASDYPASVIATGATINVQGSGGARSIAAGDFFEGIFTTNLKDDEIITSVSFPKSEGVYVKFFQSASRFAVVGIAAVKSGDGVQVGVTGVSDTPYRASGVESAFGDGAEKAAEHAVDGVDVMGDHFASEEYRSHLAKVMVKRALEAL